MNETFCRVFLKMTGKPNYQSCLDEMYGLRRFGIKLGLGTIKNILAGIGNPQRNFSCIHISGTNGKGSVASALSGILHGSGYKVGLYTSPHLVRFNERICVDNKPISNPHIVQAYLAVKEAHQGQREPTFFEFTTAMAFWEFGRQKVEWAVIETGMGGRLDATNVIRPKISIVTNISLEHREYLGNTIAEIAGEKGGIIKYRTPVVTGVKQKAAIDTLAAAAEEKKAPLYRLGKDFRVRRSGDGTFTYSGVSGNLKKVKTGLSGAFQVDNAALIVAACEVLNQKHARIPMDQIVSGIEKNKWPGRLEVVSTSPFVMFDGAHNLAAVKNLARHLKDNFSDRSVTLVMGILNDKPYPAMMKALLPLCRKLVLTRANTERALPTETLLPVAKKMVSDITVIDDVADAVTTTIDNTAPDEAVCIAGSLYVVGEAKEALEKRGIPAFGLNG